MINTIFYSVNTKLFWQSMSSNWHQWRQSLFKKKTYFHTCNCIKTCHSKSVYFKTLAYRLREVIMKMVYRLHSTYFIVNYLLVFGLDSRYVNLQTSSQHWYCPINKANKTIVEIWTSKCWIKVNAYDFSACGWVLVPGSMIRPVVCTSAFEIVYKILFIEIYSS